MATLLNAGRIRITTDALLDNAKINAQILELLIKQINEGAPAVYIIQELEEMRLSMLSICGTVVEIVTDVDAGDRAADN